MGNSDNDVDRRDAQTSSEAKTIDVLKTLVENNRNSVSDTVDRLQALHVERDALVDRLSELAIEQMKHERFGSYWPVLLIVCPYAVLIFGVGFFWILLGVPILWSVIITIPVLVATVQACIKLFVSRPFDKISLDASNVSERLRKLENELEVLNIFLETQQILLAKNIKLLSAEENRLQQKALRKERRAHLSTSGLIGAQNYGHLLDKKFLEYVKQVFHELGYSFLEKSASNLFEIDLIVSISSETKVAIQVKGCQGAIHSNSVRLADEGVTYYKCDHGAIITNSGFTRNAVKLARVRGIRLIDRARLDRLALGRIYPVVDHGKPDTHITRSENNEV